MRTTSRFICCFWKFAVAALTFASTSAASLLISRTILKHVIKYSRSAKFKEHGATVASHVTVGSGQTFYIYGEREIALTLLSIPKGSTIKARANTAFGIARQFLFADDEPVAERRSETGLVITQILSTEPAAT